MRTPRAQPDPRAVLFISQRADFFGGGQHSLRDLAVYLRDTSFRPCVVLPGAGPLAEDLLKAGVEVRTLPLPSARRGSMAGVMRTIWALATLARREEAALLHSDSPRTALYAGLAARLARRPHLWHVRASLPSSALSDRLLAGVSDRIVAVSRAAATRSAALRRAKTMSVVRTGIPAPACLERDAARDALGLPRDRFIAGVIGRVERDKGSDHAVAALPALNAAVPGARLAFLGTYDDRGAFARSLNDSAAAYAVRGQIDLLGPRDSAARYLPAFDLILHPSRHEALPRVLIEALFAGIPAVAADVGGVREVVQDGVTGLLSPARNAPALAAAAAALAKDPDRRRLMSLASRRVARERFTIEAMGRDIVALYEAMLRPAGTGTLLREATR